MRMLVSTLLLGCTALFGPTGFAEGAAWSELSEIERRQLADFQPYWNDLSSQRKAQLRRSSSQIERMPAVNRNRLLRNLNRINSMNSE